MGTPIEVKASNPKTDQECAVMYDFGGTIEEAVDNFTGDVVHSLYVAQAKVVLQAALRRCMEQGRDPGDFAASWKPGVKAPSIAADPIAAAKAAFAKMSDEDKAAFLQSLKG